MKKRRVAAGRSTLPQLPQCLVVSSILPRIPQRYVTGVYLLRAVCRAARGLINGGGDQSQLFWELYRRTNMPGIVPDPRKVMETIRRLKIPYHRPEAYVDFTLYDGARFAATQLYIGDHLDALPRYCVHMTFAGEQYIGEPGPTQVELPCIQMWGQVLFHFVDKWGVDDESNPRAYAAKAHAHRDAPVIFAKAGLVRASERDDLGSAVICGWVSDHGVALARCPFHCWHNCVEHLCWAKSFL